jgi:hypothetical protein
MKNLIEFLKGKKTYLLALLAGIYAALVGLGLAPHSEVLWGLLGSTALATLRAGLNQGQTPANP